MKVLKSINSINISKSVVCFGTFDGVHKGHQKILKACSDDAKKIQAYSIAIAFYPHPRLTVSDNSDLKLICDKTQKRELIEKCGIDYLLEIDFDKDFSEKTADEFLEEISKTLKAEEIIIGHDQKFGKNGNGNYILAKDLANKFGFKAQIEQCLYYDCINISSSNIRNLILKGDVEKAIDFLGHNFYIEGTVVKGKQLGRTIGFPTINLEPSLNLQIMPKNGVYLGKVEIDNAIFWGMINIGFRPTINDGNHKTIEMNIFEFDEEIYGKKVKIFPLKYLREEITFSGLENLVVQLKKDRSLCKNIISKI